MGLDATAKGINPISMGYSRFNFYRGQVVKAFNKEMGDIYHNQTLAILSDKPICETEIKRWDELSNDDLDTFFFHSDCGGKFTPMECKKIYEAIKDLDVDEGYEYLKGYHEKWVNMFRHCYKRRVNLYFF